MPVSAEIFVAYDSALLTYTSVETAETLVASGWTIQENLGTGNGTPMDTVRIAMATDDDVLTGDGDLIKVNFQVADRRAPASSPLVLTHALLNDGTPGVTTTDGSVTLVGVDGAIASAPEQIIPRWPVMVTVEDADEDRDEQATDSFAVRLRNGAQSETVIVSETDISSGIFTGSISTEFSLSPVSEDGVVQAQSGDVIQFCYDDSLDGAGTTVELSVYDVAGQRVRRLVSGSLGAGGHKVMWDGRDGMGVPVGSGVYLCRLQVEGEYEQVHPMLLLK